MTVLIYAMHTAFYWDRRDSSSLFSFSMCSVMALLTK
jgi:hypothetical protein